MRIRTPSLVQRTGILGTSLAAMALILIPTAACAGPRHQGGWHGTPERHSVVRTLPRHCERIRVGHRVFYYHRGDFYRRVPRGFLTVRAPIGARVSSLPSRCCLLGSGRNTFFISLGVAYQRCPKGYKVVKPPCRLRPRHPRHHGPRHPHPFSFRRSPGRH